MKFFCSVLQFESVHFIKFRSVQIECQHRPFYPPNPHIRHHTSHIRHPTSHIPHQTSHIPHPTSHISKSIHSSSGLPSPLRWPGHQCGFHPVR
ncbi:MAG: hypothetical protein EAY75_15135 [Bacteroidetes bacterium]|nr:MAG: hypothetical protein EAY75_15135 [Bacteroidota bacterium]